MRLIDADALKLTHCKECTLYPDDCLEKDGGECDWCSIYHIKYLAPTIMDAVPLAQYRSMERTVYKLQKALSDADPVAHGKWNWQRYHVWVCSQCGENPTKGMGYVQSKDELFKYCPNCGARMDGDSAE